MRIVLIILAALSLSATMAFAQHRDFHRGFDVRRGGVGVVIPGTNPCLTWNGVAWFNTCVSGVYRGDVYHRGVGVRRGVHR